MTGRGRANDDRGLDECSDAGDVGEELPPVERVTVDGRVVSVVELGNASGRPAVLLPGLSDGLAPVTEPRMRQMLSDLPLPMERFRCLVVSHPDPVPADATTRRLADDAADVLRRLLDEPALVVSHSMGAMVAQHLAVDAPDLVAGLVLSATLGRTDDRFRAVLARWDAWLHLGDIRGFLRDALEASFTGEERERRLAEFDAEQSPPPSRGSVDRHLALSAACASHDALDRVRDIRCPTLVISGAEDEVVPPRHARQLAAAIPPAHLEILDGLGHAFPEQAPDVYEALVTAFLERLPPRAASATPSS